MADPVETPPLPNLILYQTEAQRVENVLERTPSPPLIWRSGSATDNNTQRIFVTSKCNPFSFVQKSVLNKWIIEGNWICTFFPFKQKCELKSVVYIVICLTVAGIWQYFLLYMVTLYSLISFTSTMYFCSFHNLFQSDFPAKSGFDEYKWQGYYYPFQWWLAVVLWRSVFSVVWSIVCNRWCAQLFFFFFLSGEVAWWPQTRLLWLLDEVRQIFENAFFVVFFSQSQL